VTIFLRCNNRYIASGTTREMIICISSESWEENIENKKMYPVKKVPEIKKLFNSLFD
jgi:hypothetical protein